MLTLNNADLSYAVIISAQETALLKELLYNDFFFIAMNSLLADKYTADSAGNISILFVY